MTKGRLVFETVDGKREVLCEDVVDFVASAMVRHASGGLAMTTMTSTPEKCIRSGLIDELHTKLVVAPAMHELEKQVTARKVHAATLSNIKGIPKVQ